MEIKDIIKQRRIEKGMTMKQIAEAVDVSEATVSRWESGDIANMKRDKLYSLAKILNLSPATLMGLEDPSQYENELMQKIRSLSAPEREELENYLDFIISKRG